MPTSTRRSGIKAPTQKRVRLPKKKRSVAASTRSSSEAETISGQVPPGRALSIFKPMETTMKVYREACNEVAVHLFVTDASTIGLAPGNWPSTIDTDMGNGQAFRCQHMNVGRSGQFEYAEYRQALGCIRLRVYND